jgi:hypothetical protein
MSCHGLSARAIHHTGSIYSQVSFSVIQFFVGCHNAHQGSPKQDVTVHDVMGRLVIEIPLKQE